MPTFKELVDEVALNLQGFTLRQDRSTHLTANVTSTATSMTLASADNVAKGMIQIDDELIWVDSYNKSTGTLFVLLVILCLVLAHTLLNTHLHK